MNPVTKPRPAATLRASCALSIPSIVDGFLNTARSYQMPRPIIPKNTRITVNKRDPLPSVILWMKSCSGIGLQVLQPVFLELAQQCAPADADAAGGRGTIASRLLERADDQLLLRFLQ